MKVVVDTNIFFSALLKNNNKFRNALLLNTQPSFCSCYLLIAELFKYKEKLVNLSQIDEYDLLKVFYEMLKNIELYNENLITKQSFSESYKLCKNIDLKDIPFVALTIELDGLLWTGDTKLKEGLLKKGFKNFYEPQQ